MINFLKKQWYWLCKTNMGKMFYSMILTVISFGITSLENISELTYSIFNVLGFIGLSIILGFALVLFVYAWIINPIREYKKRKKEREFYNKEK